MLRTNFPKSFVVNRTLQFLWIIVSERRPEYYEGAGGGLCNDESDVIRSQAECTKALKELGYKSMGDNWTGEYDQIPSGCSISKVAISGDVPHFETSRRGLGKGRNDLSPICYGPRIAGDFRWKE